MHQLIGTPPDTINPVIKHVESLESQADCEKIGFFDLIDAEPVKFLLYNMKSPPPDVHDILFPSQACRDYLMNECGWPEHVISNPVEIVTYAAVFYKKKAKAMLSDLWKSHEQKVAGSATRETSIKGLVMSSSTVDKGRVTVAEIAE